MKLRSSTFWVAAIFSLAVKLSAQDSATPAPSPNAKLAPPIKDLGHGIFQVGEVTLDKNSRSATFAGAVNASDASIEYLIVTQGGKTHESLLVTDVDPYHLHLAMLLLGAKGDPKSAVPSEEPVAGQIDAASLKTAPELKGDSVTISLKWRVDGKEMTGRVEDWIHDESRNKSATRGAWIYNGSSLYKGRLVAQIEGAVASLVTDPAALINNPRAGHDNDAIWGVEKNVVPPLKTPVEITIQLEKPPTQ